MISSQQKMSDYSSSDMDEKLRIPTGKGQKPKRQKYQKPQLNSHEIFLQRDQILTSTIKTNQLVSQIHDAKKARSKNDIEENQIQKLESTTYVDDIIKDHKRLRKINEWLPSEELMEQQRNQEAISEEKLGLMIGKSMTKTSNLDQIEKQLIEENGFSQLGARIMQGKMPLSEIQEITKDRQADLSAVDLGEDVVNYDRMYANQDEYAQYLPQYAPKEEITTKQRLQQQVVEQIMAGIPASLLVHVNMQLFKQTLFHTTFIQFSDLENVARIVISSEDDLQRYLMNKSCKKSDFYQSIYLNYPQHRPSKNYLYSNDDINVTYQLPCEQIIEEIDQFSTTVETDQIFTDQYLSQFVEEYGQLFMQNLINCEQDLVEIRQKQVDDVNKVLKRDYEFELQANKQSTKQEKEILKMGNNREIKEVGDVILFSRLDNLEDFERKINNGQFIYDFLIKSENQILVENAIDILSSTSLFVHPNENLDWENNDLLDDFLVENDIGLDPQLPEPIEENEYFQEYIKQRLEKGHTDQSAQLEEYFIKLQTDINEQMAVFESVHDNYDKINKFLHVYQILVEDQKTLQELISELESEKQTHTSENMMNIFKANLNRAVEKIYKLKVNFNLIKDIPEFIKIEKMTPDEFYKVNLDKVTQLSI